MKFSLIVGTLNRPKQIRECMMSLLNQKFRDFEIIIIDQSDDNETSKVINKINSEEIPIIYKKVVFKGLSKARNEALKYTSGEYFCLIDDDAYYDSDYLLIAYSKLKSIKNVRIILSGYIYDKSKNEELANYGIAKTGEILSYNKMFLISLSASLIFPISVVKECGNFDERFGVGGEFGACEETDLLIRALRKKYRIIYLKEMKVCHPKTDIALESTDKAYNYFKGAGALIKKHLIYGLNFHVFIKALRFTFSPIIKQFLLRETTKSYYYKAKLKGYIEGLKEYND